MNLSSLISKLQAIKDAYGDHPVLTEDGYILDVEGEPLRNGRILVAPDETQNEVGLSFSLVEGTRK